MNNVPAETPIEQRSAGFQRMEGFDMSVGRVIAYQLTTTGFTIVCHRLGVAFRGTVPVVQRAGMDSLIDVFRRAIIHQEHLKWSFDEGQQSYLSEDQVTLRLKPPSDVIAFPGRGAGSDLQGNSITGP